MRKIVAYRYTVNGNTYTGGKKCRAWYDPANPAESFLIRKTGWTAEIILAVSIPFIIVGLVLLIRVVGKAIWQFRMRLAGQ